MTITNATRAQLEQLAHQLKNLKVEEREALDQMLPERKVFRASEEERAHQDLVYANSRGSLKEQAQRVESDSRRLQGLAKNAATLNTNQQKQYQLIRNFFDAHGQDHELFHAMGTKFLASYEMDRRDEREERRRDRGEMDCFKADLMEEVLSLKERLDRMQR